MEDLAIRVNNETESKESQSLLGELGAVGGISEVKSKWVCSLGGYITLYDFLPCVTFNVVTIHELCDLVILKRNCVGDATHYLRDMKYISIDSQWYYFSKSKSCWLVSKNTKEQMLNLKPIEKEMKMKEYLDKDYVLRSVKQTAGDNRVPDEWIEVPEGAVKAVEQYIVGVLS